MEAEAHIPAIQQTVESFFKPKDELLRCVDAVPPMHHTNWPGEHAHAGAVDGASNGAVGYATTHPTTVDPTTSAGEAPQVRTQRVDPREGRLHASDRSRQQHATRASFINTHHPTGFVSCVLPAPA